MINIPGFKWIASIVIVCYLSLIHASSIAAMNAQTPNLAQAGERGLMLDGDNSQPKTPSSSPVIPNAPQMTPEEQDALQQIYAEKIKRLEADMNAARGRRKNLLSLAITAFSVGASVTYAVDTVNDAIDDISTQNPEDETTEDPVEERYDDCCQYVSYTEEKQDAQDSLDGIKGIGGGIFLVGIAGTVGYLLYTYKIRQTQKDIDTLRAETGGTFEPRGLTPEYLRRNESTAAILEEIEELKKKAGSIRTKGEIFLRFALGSLAGGIFLVGVSNISDTVVGNITIDEDDPDDVAAKEDALDKADDLNTAGTVFLGIGLASGVASFVLERMAQGKDHQIDEFEKGLLRVADRIRFRPKRDGFAIVYTQSF